MRRAISALLAICLTGAFAGLASQPAQADGPAPKRVASGWMPYWVTSPAHPEGINSAVQNADLFTDVSPFWYSATAKSGGGVQVGLNPNFSNSATNVPWAMGQLKSVGLAVLPSIADGSGKGRMASTLADPALRTAHVNDVVALVTSGGYDGIDLDYETFAFTDGSSTWGATMPNWTAFINELSAALHGQGKLLSVTIPPPCSTGGACGIDKGYTVYNMTGIAPAVDRLRIMAYDYHVGAPGPIAPMPWVRSIVQYSVSVMDPAKLQIGVPTYGRAWTLKNSAGKYQLQGNCPASGSSAYRSLTATSSVSDRDIPALLPTLGKTAADVQWSDSDQENFLNYDKTVQWTDSSGAKQTCTAKRVLWFVGPQAVLARTQLVGEFGLGAAAYWTVGGEDPQQWPMIRAYAQSLAPAATDIAATGLADVVFGTGMPVTAVVTSSGTPVAGAPAVLRFQQVGTKKWVDVQTVPTNPDGTVAFTSVPTASGMWAVFVAGVTGRTEGTSPPFTTQVLSSVVAKPKKVKAPAGSTIVVRVVAQPAIAGQRVVIQVKSGESWQPLGADRVNARGVAKVSARLPKAKGRYTLRAVALARGAILTGASAEFPVRVTR